MTALRLILLVAGLLLIVTLAWRGRRGASQAAGKPQTGQGAESDADGRHEFAGAARPATSTEELPPVSPLRAVPRIDWPEHAVAGEAVADAAGSTDVLAPAPEAGAALPTDATGQSTTDALIGDSELLAGEIRLAWPSEQERRIFALRVVPRVRDRLPGRELRLALEAQGLRHGPLGIFHLPDAAGVSMLCAANIAKPGMLDPQQMDFQSFSGLNLFIVLPGPEAAAELVDLLIGVARELCQRVDGRLQDDSGVPLGAARLAELREQLLSDGPDAGN